MQRASKLRGKQVPLLLAYLVLNRDRALGREELSGALWSENAPVSEDAALRTLLSRLRSALPEATLTGRDELQLELPQPVWIDVEAAASALERARVALARNDARGGWALAQVPLNIASRGLLPGAQARWLEARRRELEDLRLEALELIGRAGLRLGREQLPSVQRAARALIDAEPFRESGYTLLMEALAAGGDTAEALRVFDRLRQLLRDELGTTPSEPAIALNDRLLNPTRRAAGAPRALEGITVALPGELQARAQEPLVGRKAELAELNRLWHAAVDGDGPEVSARLVLLTGEAGVGKSRLVGELARRVHEQGAVVLAGRCSRDALLPYQPFVEGLRHYVLGVPVSQLLASTREYGGELARLLPELRRRVPELAEPAPGEADTERYRLFEAVVGLLAEIAAGAPLLLVIEDLQWADRPTMLLLRHVTRTPDLGRVLILGGLRSTDGDVDAFHEALAEFRRAGLLATVDLQGLAEPETRELVSLRTGRTPTAQLVRALQRRTEGNPFFVEEIVRQLVEAGEQIDSAGSAALERVGVPEGVKQVIARRLERMGPEAIEWLRAAAVIGREFDIALVEEVVSVGEEQFLTALDDALAAGLVVEAPGAPGSYSFSHALIRETLYEGMSLPRRTRIHRRVGEALETPERRGSMPSLALHFTRAAGPQDAEKAIAYARAAGAQAADMLAHEEAAAHLARALEVQDRFRRDNRELRLELLLALSEARVRAGERSLAWSTFREAANLAAQLNDSHGLARAAIGASRRYIQPPGVVDEQLIALLEEALALTEGERSVVRVALLTRMCGALYFSPQRERMAALADEATAIADELQDPEAGALAAAARRRAYWNAAHLARRISDATAILTLGQQAGDLELVLQGHAWLVVDLLEHGDAAAVDAQIEAFAAGAERLRQPLYLWHASVWRAMRALLAGRLEEAERLAAEALSTGAASETVTASNYYAVQLMSIRREQGRMAELEPSAQQLIAANPTRPAWRAALAVLLAETGREQEARHELQTLAGGGLDQIPPDGDWMTAVALLSDAAADVGDRDTAARLYELLEPYSTGNVVVGFGAVCFGSVARHLGRLAATIGEPDVAREHLEYALRADAELRAPLWLAHAQVAYAAVLGPRSRRGRELLDAAVRTAEDLRLPRVLRRARDVGW